MELRVFQEDCVPKHSSRQIPRPRGLTFQKKHNEPAREEKKRAGESTRPTSPNAAVVSSVAATELRVLMTRLERCMSAASPATVSANMESHGLSSDSDLLPVLCISKRPAKRFAAKVGF